MLGDIIMNLFMNATEKQGRSVNNFLFSPIKGWKNILVPRLSSGLSTKEKIEDTKPIYVNIIILKKKDYLDGLLSIMIDEANLMKRTNQWFYNIQDFNKEHIIRPYNVIIPK